MRKKRKARQNRKKLYIIVSVAVILIAAAAIVFGKKKDNLSYGTAPAPVIIGDYDYNNNPVQDTTNHALNRATVVRVVDGDTFIANIDGEEVRVRMLEVDTPESVHEDASKNNEFGALASDYTKERLKEGKTVYLEYGTEQTDQYGLTSSGVSTPLPAQLNL